MCVRAVQNLWTTASRLLLVLTDYGTALVQLDGDMLCIKCPGDANVTV